MSSPIPSPVEPGQHYCLKWNNHPKNISGVFDRLRSSERFIDVNLSSADRKTIKCHRLLLSAGSGYLEEILCQNPSAHPTIVLSQIHHAELKMLIEFMYVGEVAVEQEKLPKLLEAARILKIKGLCESNDDDSDELPPTVATSDSEASQPADPSQDRKRKRKGSSADDGVTSSKQPLLPPSTKPLSLPSPLFGVANAYFLTQKPTMMKSMMDKVDLNDKQMIADIPNLMSQASSPVVHPALVSAAISSLTPYMTSLTPSSTEATKTSASEQPPPKTVSPTSTSTSTNISKLISQHFLSSTPVRRYKQYTEDSLQLALKEIMDGQSINRSSMKYNIPARTLRDWMKRLNIKSVFTHHSHKNGSTESRSASTEEQEKGTISSTTEPSDSSIPKLPELSAPPSSAPLSAPPTSVAFPGMPTPMNGMAFPGMNRNGIKDEDEEEEEIDDDEEEKLKIVEEQ